MDMRASLALSDMRVGHPATTSKHSQKRTAAEVASRVFARAEESGDAILTLTAEQWRKEWLSSDLFTLVDLPLHLVASPLPATNDNRVQGAIRAASDSVEPIVVDLNKKKIGRLAAAGNFFPPVIVIDGQHRYKGHYIAGQQRIKAWVGTLAAAALGLTKIGVIQADHQMGASELQQKIGVLIRERAKGDPDCPMSDGGMYPLMPYVSEVYPYENYFVYSHGQKNWRQNFKISGKDRQVEFVGKPREVVQRYVNASSAYTVPRALQATPMEQAMDMVAAHRGMRMPNMKKLPKVKKFKANAGGGMGSPAGGSSSLGNGSGPSPKKVVPSSSASPAIAAREKVGKIRTKDKRLKGTGYFGYKSATKTMSDKTKGSTKGEMASKLQGTGYYGYQKASKKMSEKTKGSPKGEMTNQLMGEAELANIVAEYIKACDSGYKGTMKSVAPPGMEHVVKGLKHRFKKGSSSPFAIAWWLHNKNKD